MARPPVAEHRLERRADGQLLYHLKNEWRDGTRAILLSPMEFLEKLTALVPPPRRHLAHFHGVLAPNAVWRDKVVPRQIETLAETPASGEEKSPPPETAQAKARRLRWADLLKRIFQVDVTTCPDCGGSVRLIAVIKDPNVTQKILVHLGLPSRPPSKASSRTPPNENDWMESLF